MKLDDFSGGLNNKIAPHLLRDNEAQILINVDVSSGSLKPIRRGELKDIDIDINNDVFFFSHPHNEYKMSAVGSKKWIDFRNNTYSSTNEGTIKFVEPGPDNFRRLTLDPPPDFNTDLKDTNYIPANVDISKAVDDASDDLYFDLKLGLYEYIILKYDNDDPKNLLSSRKFRCLYSPEGFALLFMSPTNINVDGHIDLDIKVVEQGISAFKFNILADDTDDYNYIIYRRYSEFKTADDGTIKTDEPIKVDFTSTTEYRVVMDMTLLEHSSTRSLLTFIDANFDNSAGDLLDSYLELDGNYSYVATYYDTVSGTESRPTNPTITTPARSGEITVQNLKASTQFNNKIRLYRLGENVTKYTLVAELDNVDQDYQDRTPNDKIVGNHILDTLDAGPANNGKGRYLTEYKSMLFAAYGTKIYFSDIVDTWRWSEFNYIQFDEQITGMAKTLYGLLVFSRTKTYLVTGSDKYTFSLQTLSNNKGCIDHSTIKQTKDVTIWLSSDEVLYSNGASVNSLTANTLRGYDFSTVVNTVLMDDKYVINLPNNKFLIYDFKVNKFFREANIKYIRYMIEGKYYMQYFRELDNFVPVSDNNVNNDGNDNNYLGCSVDMADGKLLVGGYGYNSNDGMVIYYSIDSVGNITKKQEINPTAGNGLKFGKHLTMNFTDLFIEEDDKLHYYKYNSDNDVFDYTKTFTDIVIDGSKLDLSGTHLFVAGGQTVDYYKFMYGDELNKVNSFTLVDDNIVDISSDTNYLAISTTDSTYLYDYTNSELIFKIVDTTSTITSVKLFLVDTKRLLAVGSLNWVKYYEIYDNMTYEHIKSYYNVSVNSLTFDRYNLVHCNQYFDGDNTDEGSFSIMKSDLMLGRYEYNGNGAILDYHWKSPKYTEGALTNLKRYKDIYIAYKGKVEFNVYIDEKLVNSVQLNSDTFDVYNLKTTHNYGGYSIEFELKGTAEVYEIEYKALPKQTGD